MAWKCGLDSPGDQRLRGKAMADQAASGKGFTGMRGGLRREEEPAGGRGSETGAELQGRMAGQGHPEREQQPCRQPPPSSWTTTHQARRSVTGTQLRVLLGPPSAPSCLPLSFGLSLVWVRGLCSEGGLAS